MNDSLDICSGMLKRFIPIRGAIMLFGSPLAVHQLIPRPTLDFQFLGYATDEPMPETRWIDRIVCEENIIQAWDQLVSKYKFFMPKPFKDQAAGFSDRERQGKNGAPSG